MAECALDYKQITAFRTKGDKYCLVLRGKDQSALPYQINMIRYNQIGTLLPIQFFIEDGEYQYYYDISQTNSYEKWMQHKKLCWDDIYGLLTQLYRTTSRMEDFLLDLEGILLMPEYIFCRQENTEYWFCYYPDKKESFEYSLCELLEFFLNHIDYGDDETVRRTYDLYQKVRKEHIPFAHIMQLYGAEAAYELSEEPSEPFEMEKKNPIWNARELKEDDYDHAQEQYETKEEKKLVSTIVPYIPDLVGAILVARMAYYLYEHHDSMTGVQFGIWLGGIALIVAISALWASYLGRKEEEAQYVQKVLVNQPAVNEYSESEPAEPSAEKFLNQKKDSDKDTIRKFSPWKQPRNKYRINTRIPEEASCEKEYDYEESVFLAEEEIRETIPATRKTGGNDEIPKTRIMGGDSAEEKQCMVFVSQNRSLYEDILLTDPVMVIGKVRGFVDVYLDAPFISRVHAQVQQDVLGCSIMDLGSTNGTFVNGKKLREQEKISLKPGDEVSFADLKYQIACEYT